MARCTLTAVGHWSVNVHSNTHRQNSKFDNLMWWAGRADTYRGVAGDLIPNPKTEKTPRIKDVSIIFVHTSSVDFGHRYTLCCPLLAHQISTYLILCKMKVRLFHLLFEMKCVMSLNDGGNFSHLINLSTLEPG